MSAIGGPNIIEDGLVLSLDAGNHISYPGSGTTWTDLSGNGNTGTLTNGPTFNTDNGGSIGFDGSNDYVLISCNNSTIRTYNSTTQFTVKLPFYSGGQRCILSYRTGAGLLYIGKLNGGIFCYYDQLSNPFFIAGSIENDTITVCSLTCDADNSLFTMYINGNLISAVSRTGWASSYHSSLHLGYDGGTNEYMVGNFYQFFHYNRVLSASEILQNYNATKGRFGL
jgi:hypothetical protein